MIMEQVVLYICAAGGLAGIAAIFTVFVNHAKYKRDSNLEVLKTQIQAMQNGFDSQLKALTESVTSWKGLWEASMHEIRELREASTQEIRELKIEIKELRSEIDKLRTENAELKGQLKEHYKLA
jgi:chromosome segregation ATPase